MNRRNFIKTTALALPLSTLMAENVINPSKRRSPNSYFTNDEMKKWCEKNGCHYLTDNELNDKNLVMAFTITSEDITVNEQYMDSWLKEMRNDRGNPDYKFRIADVRPTNLYFCESGCEKDCVSVHYVYGKFN